MDSGENQTFGNEERMQVTCEFDLPIGYEDENGKVHRHVVMRRVKGIDQIKLRHDKEIQDLAREKYSLRSSNPAESQLVVAAVQMINTVIYSLVIERLGDLGPGQINRDLLRKLYSADLERIDDEYSKLNGIDKKKVAELMDVFQKGGQLPFGE